MADPNPEVSERAIAVIGMAGRFPGAADLSEFWNNLRKGVESISFFTQEELMEAGVPVDWLSRPNYVRAGGWLSGAEFFDADYFGYSRSEAALLDPQHRIFLETAQDALDNANCLPSTVDGGVGVFAGVGRSAYLVRQLGEESGSDFAADYAKMISNDQDFLATRVAYKLDLTGPAMTILTACSSSLTAVHQACQSLILYECEVALAGGTSVMDCRKSGYFHQEGMILSPDGHCRAFDAEAGGTVIGNGGGIVVLKRLRDALEDGDLIDAVILSSAVNNDGGEKIGYTAPSIRGQTEVVKMAQALAQVGPEDITYIEAHGTATPLGDPVEVMALKQAFPMGTAGEKWCGLGSVKTNIGHLGASAGVAGLIKTVLALKYGELPPSLHFRQPNPEIDIESGAFFVVDQLTPWERGAGVRRAGVSSFGIGGTNVHVVLEEAPERDLSVGASGDPCLLPVSAASPQALSLLIASYRNALGHADGFREASIADLCFTASCRRRHHAYREVFEARDRDELRTNIEGYLAASGDQADRREVPQGAAEKPVFVFSGWTLGWGTLGRELIEREALFKESMEECDECIQERGEGSIVEALRREDERGIAESLTLSSLGGLALQISLARLWASWGVKPAAVVGQGEGEIAAAQVAGILTLKDSVNIAATRIKTVKPLRGKGALLLVGGSEEGVEPLLVGSGDEVTLAGVYSLDRTLVSGSREGISAFEQRAYQAGIRTRRIPIDFAAHSPEVEALREPFMASVGRLETAMPSVPFYSTVSQGRDPKAGMDAAYWFRGLRDPVRIPQAIQFLMEDGFCFYLGMGPGAGLAPAIVKAYRDANTPRVVLRSLYRHRAASAVMRDSLGQCYRYGAAVDWDKVWENRDARPARIPGYGWDRQRFFAESNQVKSASREGRDSAETVESVSEKEKGTDVETDARAGRSDPRTDSCRSRDELEQILKSLWVELLGETHVGMEDNFFDLGGHSLLSVQLLDRVEAMTGERIELSVFLQEPTIRGLVHRVENREGAWSPIVPIQIRGWKPAMFCVTPITGLAFPYFEFGKLVGREQPFYALQPPGLDASQQMLWTVPALAQFYVEAVQRVQPTGPYHLCGWSFGASVAFEMACQLRRQGKEVGLVALLDTPVTLPTAKASRFKAARFFVTTILGNLLPYMKEFGRILLFPQSKVERVQMESFHRKRLSRYVRVFWAGLTLTRVFVASAVAAARYRVDSYAGRVQLFRTSQCFLDSTNDESWGWQSVVQGGVEIREIPGNHMTILLDPHVEEVGRAVRERLEAWQTEHQDSGA